MSGGWARYAVERFRLLKRWRDFAPFIAKACRDVLADACRKVYVVGGAAEDRLTVLSDIDVVIVVDDPRLKSLETIVRIKRRAEELGIPEELPLDIKIVTAEELQDLVRRSVYRRLIEIGDEGRDRS